MTKWKLVPVEPTETQVQAGLTVFSVATRYLMKQIYRGMVKVSSYPTDDAELVERGGRAICEADGHDWDKLGSGPYHRRERQAIYKRQFRAALKAIQDGGEGRK